jgi:diguanylate cyclase (GGDEF)-like protein
VCRYGGEEFCILLPETDRSGAIVWAERCCSTIAKTPVQIGDVELQVTASFGVAEREETTRSAEHLLDLADQALLLAKREGKNRVVAWSSATFEKAATI